MDALKVRDVQLRCIHLEARQRYGGPFPDQHRWMDSLSVLLIELPSTINWMQSNARFDSNRLHSTLQLWHVILALLSSGQ
jgi:hypothetical protein